MEMPMSCKVYSTMVVIALALGYITILTTPAAALVSVLPTVETDLAYGTGDKADDLAIWVHPTDPNLSTIIGMSKASRGGIHVYDMTGQELQFIQEGSIGNLDIRYGFPLNGRLVDLVTAASRTNNGILAYSVDPATRQLQPVTAQTIPVGIKVYGLCMYHSLITDTYYTIVTSKSGHVEQWELYDDGYGGVDANRVRGFDVGGQCEGCVADDQLAALYIGQEDVGIWKYHAEPTDTITRTKVDKTGRGGHLVADVEGLTIYYGSDGTGYLIASSQGNNSFTVYRRQLCNDYLGTFKISDNPALDIDGCESTDGIDVTGAPLGSAFPQGAFVAHDSRNSGGHCSNYKLVPWQSVVPATHSDDPSKCMTIRKIKVKAGTSRDWPSDSFDMSGFLYHVTETEIANTDSIHISISNEEEDVPVFFQSIQSDRITYKKGRYLFKDADAGINYFKLDIDNNRFSIKADNVNLTGLKSPVIVTVETGAHVGIAVGYDHTYTQSPNETTDRINGKKPMPTQLLHGYENSLRIDKCKFKHDPQKPSNDTLYIKGAMALQDTSTDLANEDILVTWGSYNLTLPATDIYRSRSRRVFKYKKPKGTDSSIAAAIFDLNKCTFRIVIRNATIGPQEDTVDFGIQFSDFNVHRQCPSQ